MSASLRAPHGDSGNLLLDALPRQEWERLLAGTQPVSLDVRQVLFEAGKAILKVYFPMGAVVSLVNIMIDGSTVEMATIGKEGIVGVPAVLGGTSIVNARAVCQVPGDALSIDGFIDAFKKDGAFRTP